MVLLLQITNDEITLRTVGFRTDAFWPMLFPYDLPITGVALWHPSS
jgi:hypothetical protein